MTFHAPNNFRAVAGGSLATSPADGNNGLFFVMSHLAPCRITLRCICSDGEGWEHVSVRTATRAPNWTEMCYIKDLFWDDEDCVMQLHPPKSDYVNCHPYCLHLWRPTAPGVTIPRPPSIFVGPRQ